jgi:hypothetical protein
MPRRKIKLSEWAKRNGVSYKTAHRMFSKGQLPVPATQLETGTILVMVDEDEDGIPSGDTGAILKELQQINWRLRRIETHLGIA